MDCKMRLRTGDLHASQQEQIASLEAGVQAESALRGKRTAIPASNAHRQVLPL